MLKTILATTAVGALLAGAAFAQEAQAPVATDDPLIVEGEAAPADAGAVAEDAIGPVADEPALTLGDAVAPDGATPVADAAPADREGWEVKEGWERVDMTSVSADALIGVEIQTIDDEKVAEVKDVLMTPEGSVEHIAATFGGFLGFGTNTLLLTLDEIDIIKDGNDAMVVRTNLTPEALDGRPAFDG